jgi:hypothetical protein
MTGRHWAWLVGGAAIAVGAAVLACGGKEQDPMPVAAAGAGTGSGSAGSGADPAAAPFLGHWTATSGDLKSSCGEPKSLVGNEVEIKQAGPGEISLSTADCEVTLQVDGKRAATQEKKTCSKSSSAGMSTMVYDSVTMELAGQTASMTWKLSVSGKTADKEITCQYDATLTLGRQ